VMTEPVSATTKGNALFLKAMTEDRTDAFKGKKRFGLVTLLYHMSDVVTEKGRKPGALSLFQEVFKDTGVTVDPLFAEEVLAAYGADGPEEEISKITTYYATPKGGYQWDVNQMTDLLRRGESLTAMMR
jgi:hypothetical protein